MYASIQDAWKVPFSPAQDSQPRAHDAVSKHLAEVYKQSGWAGLKLLLPEEALHHCDKSATDNILTYLVVAFVIFAVLDALRTAGRV